MNESMKNIMPASFLIAIIAAIIYLIFFTNDVYSEGKIKMIEIKNNRLLSAEDYFAFTSMNDLSPLDEIPLPIIKTRFTKHPYVEHADVLRNGLENLEINLTEKNVVAVILDKGNSYFITDEFQVLPVLTNTQLMTFPLINNLKRLKEIKPFTTYKTEEMIEAFRIIEAAKLADENISSKLSEINFRNGGDIILTFSGIECPVIFGRGEEAKKMVYLEIMWNGLIDSKNILKESDYIDLRFSKEIYVAKNTGIGG